MDLELVKMNFAMELDSNIRYYRSGVIKIPEMQKESVKQMIQFMNACKRFDIQLVEAELVKMKHAIGNMLYETLESGTLDREFSIIWTTTIHQMNQFALRCSLICERMEEQIDDQEFLEEEKKSKDDYITNIQMDTNLSILDILIQV